MWKDKLVDLLNEYELEREQGVEGLQPFKHQFPLWERSKDEDWSLCYEPICGFRWEEFCDETAEAVIISRHYGFIEWLNKNNKIRWNTPLMATIRDSFDSLLEEWDIGMNGDAAVLLMVLATSKDPIKDLTMYMLK